MKLYSLRYNAYRYHMSEVHLRKNKSIKSMKSHVQQQKQIVLITK